MARFSKEPLWREPHQAHYGPGDLPTALGKPRLRSAAGAEDARAWSASTAQMLTTTTGLGHRARPD
eukprot:scaffold8629_cov35-Phaeocystis_antarctica.AAC.2